MSEVLTFDESKFGVSEAVYNSWDFNPYDIGSVEQRNALACYMIKESVGEGKKT